MDRIPYVSVVVPMYNAEKYIAGLLDSALKQTLKNIEVIVVNDNSSDKSVKIVESYKSKFKGRLQILNLQKNSGGPSIPRNKGLEMSRGKYIFFADNDDALIDTALEELFVAAEKFNVDLVHCDSYIDLKDDRQQTLKRIGKAASESDEKIFTPMTNDLAERSNIWMNFQFGVMPWLSFVSRKFLIESGIKFRELRREDVFWTLEILLSAKNILRYAEPCYIHYTRGDSLGQSANKSLEQFFDYWMDRTVNGLKSLEEFLLGIDFFVKNPTYHYAILNHWAMGDLQQAARTCTGIHPLTIKKDFQRAFTEELGDKDTLVSFLFANSIYLIQNLMSANKKLEELGGVK